MSQIDHAYLLRQIADALENAAMLCKSRETPYLEAPPIQIRYRVALEWVQVMREFREVKAQQRPRRRLLEIAERALSDECDTCHRLFPFRHFPATHTEKIFTGIPCHGKQRPEPYAHNGGDVTASAHDLLAVLAP